MHKQAAFLTMIFSLFVSTAVQLQPVFANNYDALNVMGLSSQYDIVYNRVFIEK